MQGNLKEREKAMIRWTTSKMSIRPLGGAAAKSRRLSGREVRLVRLLFLKLGGGLLLLILFSSYVVSDTLRPRGLPHARLPCPSPSPGVCSNSCPLSHWCHPTIVCHSLLAFNFSHHQGIFQRVGSLHQVAKVNWSFSFSISPSSEYSGLISFKIAMFDLLAVQGTLKSLLQNHSSKEPILRHPAFLMVQFLHTYMTTGKTIALITWIHQIHSSFLLQCFCL